VFALSGMAAIEGLPRLRIGAPRSQGAV
jgi:hypothetical protein